MATIGNTAYYVGASQLDIAADNYTAGVNEATLIPTVPVATHTDIGGGVQQLVGSPVWVLNLGYAQDWVLDESLSHKLQADAGQLKTIKLTPIGGGRGVTVSARMVPGSIGGAAAGVAAATAALPVVGQPVWDVEAP